MSVTSMFSLYKYDDIVENVKQEYKIREYNPDCIINLLHVLCPAEARAYSTEIRIPITWISTLGVDTLDIAYNLVRAHIKMLDANNVDFRSIVKPNKELLIDRFMIFLQWIRNVRNIVPISYSIEESITKVLNESEQENSYYLWLYMLLRLTDKTFVKMDNKEVDNKLLQWFEDLDTLRSDYIEKSVNMILDIKPEEPIDTLDYTKITKKSTLSSKLKKALSTVIATPFISKFPYVDSTEKSCGAVITAEGRIKPENYNYAITWDIDNEHAITLIQTTQDTMVYIYLAGVCIVVNWKSKFEYFNNKQSNSLQLLLELIDIIKVLKKPANYIFENKVKIGYNNIDDWVFHNPIAIEV